MTTTANKQGLRAAATERRNRHAQRTPLPPKGGVEPVEVPEYAERYGSMDEKQLRSVLRNRFGMNMKAGLSVGRLLETILQKEREARVDASEKPATAPETAEGRKGWGAPPEGSKSWPKAEACIAIAGKHGWDATPELLEGDVCELTLRRGNETLWISWTAGVLTTEPMPTYTIADRVIKLRNASAVKQYAERSPETGAAELTKVSSNRFFRKKPTEPKAAKLPFDPHTASDAEIVAALMGRAVAWHNRLREIPETAQVGRNPRKIYFTEWDGERIFNFICPAGGYRAFRLSSLTRVGGRAKADAASRKHARTAAVELEEE